MKPGRACSPSSAYTRLNEARELSQSREAGKGVFAFLKKLVGALEQGVSQSREAGKGVFAIMCRIWDGRSGLSVSIP